MNPGELSQTERSQLAQLDDMFYSTGELGYVDYMASRNRILGNFTTSTELGYAFDAYMQGELSREDYEIISLSTEIETADIELE